MEKNIFIQNRYKCIFQSKNLMGNAISSSSISQHFCGISNYSQTQSNSSFLLSQQQRQFWKKNIIICNINKNFAHVRPTTKIHPSFPQISKDIGRTFPDETFMQNPHNLHRFKSILQQFCFYFPKVGYTQGLNFITGYLLIVGFSNAQTLQILVSLALHEKLLFIGLFQDSFPLIKTYCSLFWKLLNRKIPSIAAIIRNSKVPDQAWIFQWFVSIFLSTFPIQFVKKFLNYIFCKKQFAMVTLAIGVVHCLKNQIEKIQNPDQMQMFEIFDSLRCLKFFQKHIKIRKVLSYANSISRVQIKQALSECQVKNNIYYVYFMKDEERKQIWCSIIDKLARERKMFKDDPNSKIYKRNQDAVKHLERFLKQKSKQQAINSGSKHKNIQKVQNFSIDFSEEEEFLKTTGFSDSSMSKFTNFCKHVPTQALQFSSYQHNI